MPRPRAGGLILIVAFAAVSLVACDRSSPGAQDKAAGDQPINPDARALAGFLERVDQYVQLHRKLEDSLPHLSKESSPEEIDTHQRSLGQKIQNARQQAKPGDIFTPESQTAIKGLLTRVLKSPDGEGLKASIMDENPGLPNLKVNERYPDTVPLSTIPPQVLQGLPKLPEEMEFRFIGNTLILMDVHAHIIVDFVPNAFPR